MTEVLPYTLSYDLKDFSNIYTLYTSNLQIETAGIKIQIMIPQYKIAFKVNSS